MMSARFIIISILVLTSWFFAFRADAKVLWQNTPHTNGLSIEDIKAYSGAVPDKRAYAFHFVSSTNATICSVSFKISKTGTFNGSEGIDVSLVGNDNGLNVWNPDTGRKILMGSVSATQITTGNQLLTVTSTTCLPIFNSDITKKYYILFEPNWGTNTTTGIFQFAVDDQSGTDDNKLSGLAYREYIEAPYPLGWWYQDNAIWSPYHKAAPWAIVNGSSTVGFSLGYIPHQTYSNTSTGAYFWQFCDPGQDFGWWDPLISAITYLACPDQDIIVTYNNTRSNFLNKAPLGYFVLVKNIFDSQTTTGTSHFVLNYQPPYPGMATATIDITQSYLDIPSDVRSWSDIWITRIAWLGLLIYLVVRAIYLFK